MGIFDFAEKGSAANVAEQLTKMITDAGLSIKDLNVSVGDDKVVSIKGDAASQDVKDKVLSMIKSAEGVADVKDEITVAGGKAVYKVVYGDTLWGISEKFYGDGSKYMQIFEANKELWKSHNYDPNVLYPDWELQIP